MSTLARVEDLGDRLIVINANPSKRNVLSPDYYSALGDALALATSEARITCVLLRGEGGFFCAGGDLRLLAKRRELPLEQRREAVDKLHALIRAMADCPKPVIAVVEGGAAGAGVSLAFASDLIVAEAEATFTVAYVKAGLVPDGGLTSTLCSDLPLALASRMALLGEAVAAERLYALGAISEVAAQGEAFAVAMSLADRLATGPAGAQSSIKRLLRRATGASFEEQLDRERDAMADAVVSPDGREGIDAFLAKRAPDFVSRRQDS